MTKLPHLSKLFLFIESLQQSSQMAVGYLLPLGKKGPNINRVKPLVLLFGCAHMKQLRAVDVHVTAHVGQANQIAQMHLLGQTKTDTDTGHPANTVCSDTLNVIVPYNKDVQHSNLNLVI